MPPQELGAVLYFTFSCGCFLQVTNAIPCSPCSDDSDCLPFLEHCQIPEELQNIPDFLISSKSLSEDDSKGRCDYFTSINKIILNKIIKFTQHYLHAVFLYYPDLYHIQRTFTTTFKGRMQSHLRIVETLVIS